jgi:hypothetical protein
MDAETRAIMRADANYQAGRALLATVLAWLDTDRQDVQGLREALDMAKKVFGDPTKKKPYGFMHFRQRS